MKDFDSLLFSALTGANLLDFKAIIDSTESAEYSFTPRYNRIRLQILANPFKWAKKKGKPIWQRIITNVACVILICSIALGGLMIVSPTVRAAVLSWFREISGNRITYYSSGESGLTADRTAWRPTWLPEGWVVTDIYSKSSRSWWKFKERNGSGAFLTCACFDPSEESMSTIIDTDEMDKAHTTVKIQEYTADLYEGENDLLLVWEDQDGYLFWINGWMIDQATIEKIANTMTYYHEDGIDYKVDWLPDGYELKYQYESNGAAQNDWVKSGSALTFQYIMSPFCQWEEPSRDYELVDVCGVQAKYWPNRVFEEAYLDLSESAQFSTIIDYGIEKTSVLTWQDPETDTIFRLKGVLSKEDILHMAESITMREKNK